PIIINGTYSGDSTHSVSFGIASSIAPPSPPQNLQAIAGSFNITLTWQPPSNNGGASITGYKVYRSTSSGAEVGYVTIGNVTSFTNTGLTGGTTYFYKVAAVNSLGTSLLSNEASAMPPTVPSAPQNLQATAGPLTVALTWDAPSTNGGSPITGYKIYRSTSSGTEAGFASLGNVTSYTNTGLTPGVTYFYKIKAVNSLGVSAYSNEASATPTTPPTAPSAPQNLQATAGTRNATLTWDAPSSNGGSAITGYKVYRSTSSGTETGYASLGNVTSFINTGLTPGVTYFYKVLAVNSVGLSPLSNEASATPSSTVDKFGISGLYQTISGGKEWYSKWDNGIARSFGFTTDPQDPWFDAAHGSPGPYTTDGNGILKISGSIPRMFVHDPSLQDQWRNVEVTMYFMRVNDTSPDFAGMVAVARSNHLADSPPCDTRGIAGRMRVDGH